MWNKQACKAKAYFVKSDNNKQTSRTSRIQKLLAVNNERHDTTVWMMSFTRGEERARESKRASQWIKLNIYFV